jgi:hypothetical protein
MKKIFAFVLLLVTPFGHTEESKPAFSSLEQVLATIPHSINLKQGSKWNVAAVNMANVIMKEQVVGKSANVTIPIRRFEKNDGPIHPLRGCTSPREKVTINGVTVRLEAYVYVAKESLVAASTTKLSGRWLVSGTITRCELVNDGSALLLDIQNSLLDMDATRAVGAPAKSSTVKSSVVQIISATYGTGGKYADVTAAVKKIVEQNREMMVVNPGTLGADPSPGWNKELHVIYTKDGVKHEQRRGENEHVLPDSFYGAP